MFEHQYKFYFLPRTKTANISYIKFLHVKMEVTVYKGEWGDCPHKVISESVHIFTTLHIFTTHVPFGLFGIAYICLLFMI